MAEKKQTSLPDLKPLERSVATPIDFKPLEELEPVSSVTSTLNFQPQDVIKGDVSPEDYLKQQISPDLFTGLKELSQIIGKPIKAGVDGVINFIKELEDKNVQRKIAEEGKQRSIDFNKAIPFWDWDSDFAVAKHLYEKNDLDNLRKHVEWMLNRPTGDDFKKRLQSGEMFTALEAMRLFAVRKGESEFMKKNDRENITRLLKDVGPDENKKLIKEEERENVLGEISEASRE